MSCSSLNLATGGNQDWWRFSDAVGIIIRLHDEKGKSLPSELTGSQQVSNLMVELDLSGHTRVREKEEPPRRPYSSPMHGSPGEGKLTVGEVSEQTQMLIRVLKRNFPTMIHAFALFDSDDGNEVQLMEVRNAISWLYKREKGKDLGDEQALKNFDHKALIRELSSSQLAGRGATLNLNDFVRKIRFGDNVENWQEKLQVARKWRNALLEEELFKENQYISSIGTGFLEELKTKLQEKFENAAEAFVFLDRNCRGVLTEPEWKIGLKRLGVQINVHHLLKVLDGNCSDGRIDESEFTDIFAWHTLERWDKMMHEAKKNRKAIANKITMEVLFKEGQPKLPALSSHSESSVNTSSRSKTPDLTSMTRLKACENTYIGSRKRGAAEWQMELISRVAAILQPPANPNRFMFVGFQEGDVVLGVMPDASDWKRTPEILAREVHAALEKPGNALNDWDPSVRGVSKSFLLKTKKWNFTTWASRGFFDEKMKNNLLADPIVVKREHVKFPRSDVGFKTFGALDSWRCTDGVGKVGAVKDKFDLSLLRHKFNGTLLELLHFSPGFFCFQAQAGGPVLCCMEDGRVRKRSDLSRKGDGLGAVWRFHSPSTVAEYQKSEGLDLKKRFARITSSVPGRWQVGISVPHVFIENNSDSCLQIVLTAQGFVVLGGGSDPRGLIVENNQIRSLPVGEAIDYVRHRPAKPDDLTELDYLAKAQRDQRKLALALLHTPVSLPLAQQLAIAAATDGSTSVVQETVAVLDAKDREPHGDSKSHEDMKASEQAQLEILKVDLERFCEHEQTEQTSYEEMLLRDGYRECCSLLKRLHSHLSIGEILEASDRINRRAQLVRVCGDYGKEWVPGTGTSTQLAFLIDEVRQKMTQRQSVVFAHFFRMEYHQPQEVIAHLMRQLSAGVPEYEAGLSEKMLVALSSFSHERIGAALHDLCMHHVLKDKAVIIVVDNLHLAEQRVLGHMIYELRKALQPWFYPLKRQGYVRVVFSGRDGYSAPSGLSITTVQLNRLSENMARKVLSKMLRVRNKHIAPEHIETMIKKKDGCRMQYLRVAASVLQHFWVFEQNNGYVEALPELLSGLYSNCIRNLERDFGEQLVETLLLDLSHHASHGAAATAPMTPRLQTPWAGRKKELGVSTFAEFQNTFAGQYGSQKVTALLEALRELLRISPAASRIILPEGELRDAILHRYDGNQRHRRMDELKEKIHEKQIRRLQLTTGVATVLEKHNYFETGCSNLHQAVNSAAASDEVIIKKRHIHLKKGLEISRSLIISSQLEDTLITIGYGQTILQVGDDELHRLEPQPRFVVVVNGLTMKQNGFEAAEAPYCVRVSANAELHLNKCKVSSDRSVGILVSDGVLDMKHSQTVLCGSQGIVVQEGGTAKVNDCSIVSNWLPVISEAEKAMHEMFIAFCKGQTAQSYQRRLEVERNSEKQQINLAALGKRGTTLDFKEFMEVLKFLQIYPAEITKTEASNIFKKANQSEEADDSASEMDWIEFKGLMLLLCNTLSKDGFMGVKKEDLVPKASDREETWKSSNGILVRGSSSRLNVRHSEFLNCIEGCLVKRGAAAELHHCKFRHCGRDRTDSAGICSAGKGSSAVCHACEFTESDHHGVKAEKGGQIALYECRIDNARHQGVLCVGRESSVALDGCHINSAGICGLRANQNGCIQVVNTSITKCNNAGIVSSFLGTKIEVKGGVMVEGNGVQRLDEGSTETRGIVAENEGTVYISGSNDFKDDLIAHRQGRIEEPARRKANIQQSPDSSPRGTEGPAAAVEHPQQENPPKGAGDALPTKPTDDSLEEEVDKGPILWTELWAIASALQKPSKDTLKLSVKCKRPQAERVMNELSKVFDNVAEAFVMLDINSGGGVSIHELERGLKRLDIQDVDIDALSRELQLESGVELDADSFIHHFMWHGLDAFPDSSWQLAYVEASRQRRRITKRFYERSGIEQEDTTVLGSDWKSKFISDEMDKRIKSQQNFQRRLIENIKKGDHRAERKKGVQYLKGGHIYRSKDKYMAGQPYSKFAYRYGIPGTPSKYNNASGRSSVDIKVDCWQRSSLIPSESTRSLLRSSNSSITHSSGQHDMILSPDRKAVSRDAAGDIQADALNTEESGIESQSEKRMYVNDDKTASPVPRHKTYERVTGQQFPRTVNPLFGE